MQYAAHIAFEAADDAAAAAVVGQWSLTPGLAVTIASYPVPVSGTTGDAGDIVPAEAPPADPPPAG